MPKNADIQPLKEIYRARVLRMLGKEGLVDEAFVRMIMQWRHTSGFSVHNQVRIARDDEKGQESLATVQLMFSPMKGIGRGYFSDHPLFVRGTFAR